MSNPIELFRDMCRQDMEEIVATRREDQELVYSQAMERDERFKEDGSAAGCGRLVDSALGFVNVDATGYSVPVNRSEIEMAGEVAKGTAEGFTAGLLKSFHELLSLIAGPACQEIGQHFGDRIRQYRLKNAVRLLETVRDLHRTLNIPTHDVHPKLLFPILEHASLEDDSTLSEIWAGLLASASVGRTIPAFVDIAKQLTADDAKLLRSIYRASFEDSKAEREFRPKTLYDVHVGNLFLRDVLNVAADAIGPSENVDRCSMACQNLLRLRLLVEPDRGIQIGIFGYQFFQACDTRQE